MKLFRRPFVAILALSACAVAGPEIQASLGPDPDLGGGRFSTGGGITVAVDIRPSEGRTLVCGVWAQSRQQSILTKGKAPWVMTKGSVYLDGERVVQNLRFMREVPPSADYSMMEASCRLTARVWRPGDDTRALTIQIPRHVVHREVDGLAGGFDVYFLPSGPGA